MYSLKVKPKAFLILDKEMQFFQVLSLQDLVGRHFGHILLTFLKARPFYRNGRMFLQLWNSLPYEKSERMSSLTTMGPFHQHFWCQSRGTFVQIIFYVFKGNINKRACIIHQCRKTTILSCHRCLINIVVENMNNI